MSNYNLQQLRGAWGAGRASAEKAIAENASLEGKFFLTFKEGKMYWQGRVLSSQPDGCFLVQLYSWIDGAPTNQKLVKFSDMVDWMFYATHEEWLYAAAKDSYENGGAVNTPEEQLRFHYALYGKK